MSQEDIDYAQQLKDISDRLQANKETSYERSLASAAILAYSELLRVNG